MADRITPGFPAFPVKAPSEEPLAYNVFRDHVTILSKLRRAVSDTVNNHATDIENLETSVSGIATGDPDVVVIRDPLGAFGSATLGGTLTLIGGELKDNIPDDIGDATGAVTITDGVAVMTGGCGCTVGDGTTTPSTGAKVSITMLFDGTFTNWYLSCKEGETGDITFDVRRAGSSLIGAGSVPTLTAQFSANGTCAAWTTQTFSAGDIIEFSVDSVATLTIATLVLKATRTS